MLGFNGGLLGVRRSTAINAAIGVWTRNEHALAAGIQEWPLTGAVAARYWRVKSLTGITDSSFFEISELELLSGEIIRTHSVVPSVSSSPAQGSLLSVTDGSTANNVYWTKAIAVDPAFWMQFDLGTPQVITHIKVAPENFVGRCFTGATLAWSDDGISFTDLPAFTGLALAPRTLSDAASVNNP